MTATTTSRTPAMTKSMTVRQINGFFLEVQSVDEATWFKKQLKAYTTENAFTEASDVADLDRLLVLELQSFRIQRWLASGLDYEGYAIGPAMETELTKKQKELGPQISAVKNDLGLNRSAREKEAHDSVGGYLTELKIRAKAFGIFRNKQVHEALTVMFEIKSIIGTFRRSNGTERERLGALSAEEVLTHIEENLIPRFDAVDAAFRAGDQKNWAGTL